MTENGDFAQEQRGALAKLVREKTPKLLWKIEGWQSGNESGIDSPHFVALFGDMAGTHGVIEAYEKENTIYVSVGSVHECGNYSSTALFVGGDADAIYLMARELVVIRESIEMLSKL